MNTKNKTKLKSCL